MTRTRRVVHIALLGVVAMGLVACPAQQGVPPSGPAEAVGPSESPGEPAAAMAPVEAGFTHCCGSPLYRIEIECGEMLKRCYENRGGEWRQTYGRHCKEELGEGCYLADCDAKCQ